MNKKNEKKRKCCDDLQDKYDLLKSEYDTLEGNYKRLLHLHRERTKEYICLLRHITDYKAAAENKRGDREYDNKAITNNNNNHTLSECPSSPDWGDHRDTN